MPFVQQKAEQSTSSVASFTTTAMTVSPANSIVMCLSASDAANTAIVASDSAANPYALAVFKTGGVGAGNVSIYSAPVIAGGSTTFTGTPNTSAFVSISAQEYSQVVKSSPGDAVNSASGNGTQISPGAVTPSVAGCLYVACWTDGSGTSPTFPTQPSAEGWALRSNLTNTANMPLGSQDLINSGTKTGNRTMSAIAAWTAAVATFRLAPFITPPRCRPFPYATGSPPSRSSPFR